MSESPKTHQALTGDDLSRVKRELKFVPSRVENPTALTKEQIDFYNEQGYAKNLLVFSEAEITGIREYFDALLAKVMAAGGDSYSISTAHKDYGRVYDLLVHPKILDYVEDIVGDDIVGWGSHFFCKMPHDGKTVSWHQDASYWPLSPSKTVTVWLAIDDADKENACMQFIPGTHKLGHLTYRESAFEEHNVLNQTVENAEQYGDPVHCELKAGEISMHSDLLLHGSDANDSDRRRCGLTLRYCAGEVRAGLGWNEKGVVIRGSDPTGHWANPTRPEQE